MQLALQKSPLCIFFFSLETHKRCGIFSQGSKKETGSRSGVEGQQEEKVEEALQSFLGMAGVLSAPSKKSS